MNARATRQRPKLNDRTIYFGDNGRCFCGSLSCAGMTPHFTGRDLSGQRVEAVLPEDDDAAFASAGVRFRCESCGRGVSRIVLP